MTSDADSNQICSTIDDDTIELHAMRRLPEGPIRDHLGVCPSCKERVAEQRAWILDLKHALERFEAKEVSNADGLDTADGGDEEIQNEPKPKFIS